MGVADNVLSADADSLKPTEPSCPALIRHGADPRRALAEVLGNIRSTLFVLFKACP